MTNLPPSPFEIACARPTPVPPCLLQLTELARDASLAASQEFEWSHGLRVLAEAMSMHCRTRSAAEIVAFMHDEAAGREKRHSSNARREEEGGVVAVEAFDHSHAMMTMFCDQVCEDAGMEGMAHSHSHEHAKVDGFWS